MLPTIIGLVGPIRAGKSCAARYLCDRFGYRLASNSDVLRDIAKNLGMPETRDNLKLLGDSIFSVLGNDAIARFRLANRGSPIVVDGIRYIDEVSAYLHEPSFKLIGITAAEKDRYERSIALAHEGKDAKTTFSEFSNLRFARSESQVDGILMQAHAIITNDGSIGDLELKIDEVISKWSHP